MRTCIRNNISILLASVAFSVACNTASAVELSEVQFQKNQRVGFYLGSFDPLHLGHQGVMEAALTQGNLDYVIIIPTDFTRDKALTDIELRLEMLKRLYKDNPQIVVPDRYYGLPMFVRTLRRAGKSKEKPFFVGIMGEDNVEKQGILRRFGKFTLPEVKEWIVSTREDGQTPAIPEKIGGRPTKIIQGPPGISSSKIRNYLQTHPEFYSEGATLPLTEELPVPKTLVEFIREQKLYQMPKEKTNCVIRLLRLLLK